MSKPFKFRFVNEIAGGFVLVALAVVVFGIVAAGRVQGWFEPDVLVYSAFPDEGAFGLQEGAVVEVLGTVAGLVGRIEPSPSGGMQAVLKIRQRFMTYVRDDSEVLVKTRFGIGGDSFVEITRGRGGELAGEFPTLPARKDTELVEAIEQRVDEVFAEIQPVIDNVNALLVEFTGLARDLRSPEGPVQQMLSRLSSILAKVDEGEGSAGQLLNDPAVAREILAILEGLNRSIGEMEGTLRNVRATTSRLPAAADAVNVSLEQVPALLDETERTLQETRRILEGLQRHWLLRKHVEPRSAPPFSSPSALDGAPEILP